MTPGHALPAELTIYTVGELRPLWLSWLAQVSGQAATADTQDDVFALDGAAVDEVDAAGVQLLLSLSNALHQHHRVLQLRRASRALVLACNALGAQVLLAPAQTAETAESE